SVPAPPGQFRFSHSRVDRMVAPLFTAGHLLARIQSFEHEFRGYGQILSHGAAGECPGTIKKSGYGAEHFDELAGRHTIRNLENVVLLEEGDRFRDVEALTPTTENLADCPSHDIPGNSLATLEFT